MYIKPAKRRRKCRTPVWPIFLLILVIAAVILFLPKVLDKTVPDSGESSPTTQSPITEPLTEPVTEPATEPRTEPTTEPFTEPTEAPIALLEATADAGQEYIDKIIFIGDSTTYSLLYYGMLSDGTKTNQVWTPASRTLTLEHAPTTTILYPDTGEEITIKEAISRKKPEIVVITLGVNGVSFMGEEYFFVMYKKLIAQIQEASPETKIILQSIFPVATHWEKMDSINNEKIRTANGWILRIAEETGVRYLDTISVLGVAEDGYLPQDYQNGDGLHLNEKSLGIVLEYIRTHVLPEYVAPAN